MLNEKLTPTEKQLVKLLKELGATELEWYYILAFMMYEEQRRELLEYVTDTRETNMVKVLDKALTIAKIGES